MWKFASVCVVTLTAAVGTADGAIMGLDGLESITFFERTGGTAPTAHTFAFDDAALLNRIDVLDAGSRDFFGTPAEHYDVFYSDEDGAPNTDGDWITIEAVYTTAAGGGLNIAEVQLNFADESTEFASVFTNVRAGGTGAVPETAANIIDGDLMTHTTLGTGDNENRLGITVSFASVPAPATAAVLLALPAMLSRRRRARA